LEEKQVDKGFPMIALGKHGERGADAALAALAVRRIVCWVIRRGVLVHPDDRLPSRESVTTK